ncbi:hypothetical protein M0R45_036353 [Rubus argutus]|uniref:Uncharacterized protein n=1 Tax=Rubus argutus TaxID=59490 RepID=A0AAW1W1B6_RUBAR
MAAAPLFTQNPRSASTAIPKHQPNHGIFRSPQFIINTQNITTVTSQPAITSQSRAPAIITEPRNVLGTQKLRTHTSVAAVEDSRCHDVSSSDHHHPWPCLVLT